MAAILMTATSASASSVSPLRVLDSTTVCLSSDRAEYRIERPLDLSGYGAVRFTVTNHDERYGLNLVFIMEDWTAFGAGFVWNANLGRIVKGVNVHPAERKVVEFQLPDNVPSEELDDAFLAANMKGTPYSLATGLAGYRCDLSRVQCIHFDVRRVESGVSFTIEDLEFLPGDTRPYPEWAQKPFDEFMPFVDRYGQFKHTFFPGKIGSDRELRAARRAERRDLAEHRRPRGWDKFGGWKNGPQLEATGRFRTEKLDGKWWLVDPQGHLFWSHGVVRVTPSCGIAALQRADKDFDRFFEGLPADESDPLYQFYFTHDELMRPYYTARNVTRTYDFSSANAYRKYGRNYRKIFGRMAHRRLASWGMNTMANSSDDGICRMNRTPYNVRIDLPVPLEGCPKWPVLEGSTGWWKFLDPFDPLFDECVKAHLDARKDLIDSPWCIGVFVDNEIRWIDDETMPRIALRAPAEQKAKQVLVGDLVSRYKEIAALNLAWGTHFASWDELLSNREDIPGAAHDDLMAFGDKLADRYFSRIRAAFDEVVPEVLYMGCRFNRDAPRYVLEACSRYCDVISYNIYNYNLSWFRLPEGVDTPVMIGEFHFGATDRGMFHTGQVYTDSQDGRAAQYEVYVTSALENPWIVGANWHQFSDQACTGRFDGENFQVGLTDVCDNPYPEIRAALRRTGGKMYQLRAHGISPAE